MAQGWADGPAPDTSAWTTGTAFHGDYMKLYDMSTSGDPAIRSQAAEISKTLTPDEQQQFLKFQKTAHIGPAMEGTALPPVASIHDDQAVTLEDLRTHPTESLMKIGVSLKRDASDPRLWLSLAASYFAPKVFNAAAPIVGRAASNTLKGVGEVATPGMVKDLATLGLGDARVNAGLRIGTRVADAIRTVKGSTPTEPTIAEPPIQQASNPQPIVSPAAIANEQALGDIRAAVADLVKRGADPKRALTMVLQARNSKAFGSLPNSAEVASVVAAKNAVGR